MALEPLRHHLGGLFVEDDVAVGIAGLDLVQLVVRLRLPNVEASAGQLKSCSSRAQYNSLPVLVHPDHGVAARAGHLLAGADSVLRLFEVVAGNRALAFATISRGSVK
ncbi:hypothetical protein ACQP1W_00290 [Spirillospora sp. CA-255316]